MNKLFKRIAAAVTAAAVTVTAGVFSASAETVKYDVSTDLDNLTTIMKNYCFIALDELDVSGHQHGSAIAKKITKNPQPASGTDVMSELCLRDEYGSSTTYIEEFENLNGIVKIGYNKDTLRIGEKYTIRVNGSEKFIVCDGTGCEHKVESSGTVIADTATEKYMDLDNLKSSFISYNKQLAKTTASGSVTQSGQAYTVDAMSGVVYYNIDSSNYYSINADATIDFPAGSTAILVLNIDMNGITWNRKPFVLKEGGNSVSFNEDVFWHSTANRIYYNFYDSSKTDLQYTGTINMAEKGWGTIIAPSASLIVNSNFCGVLIASTVTAKGETHFVGAYNPVTPVDEGDTPVAPEHKAEIKFNKIDSEKKIALVGATFGIYSTSDCSGTPITSSSSDSSGIVHFQDISAGTYYLKEIQAPSGYKKNETIYSVLVQFDASGNGIVTFDGGKTELTIPNDPIKADVTTKATTKVTTKETTKATTKVTTKETTKATTKETTKTTVKTTSKPNTNVPGGVTTTTAPSNATTTVPSNAPTTTIPGTVTTPVPNNTMTAPSVSSTTSDSKGEAATNFAPTNTNVVTSHSNNSSDDVGFTTSHFIPSTPAATNNTTHIAADTSDNHVKDTTINATMTASSKNTTAVSSRPNNVTTKAETKKTNASSTTDEKEGNVVTEKTTVLDNDEVVETTVTTSTDTTKPPVDDDLDYDDDDDDDDDDDIIDTDDDDTDDDDEEDDDDDTDDDDDDEENDDTDDDDDNDDDDADDDSDKDNDKNKNESDSDVSGSVQTTDGSETIIVETSGGGMTWIETSTGVETSTGITSGSGDNPYTGVENAAGFAIVFGELALAAAILKKKK